MLVNLYASEWGEGLRQVMAWGWLGWVVFLGVLSWKGRRKAEEASSGGAEAGNKRVRRNDSAASLAAALTAAEAEVRAKAVR